MSGPKDSFESCLRARREIARRALSPADSLGVLAQRHHTGVPGMIANRSACLDGSPAVKRSGWVS